MQIAIGKAALTVVRLEDGRRVNVHKGRAVPSSADPEDLERLLAEDYLEVLEVADSVSEDDELEDDELEDQGDDEVEDDELEDQGDDGGIDLASILEHSVPEILAIVGDKVVLAAALLELEQAADKPRKSLIEGLEDVVAAAEEASD
jgi:hypothetical protein